MAVMPTVVPPPIIAHGLSLKNGCTSGEPLWNSVIWFFFDFDILFTTAGLTMLAKYRFIGFLLGTTKCAFSGRASSITWA